MSIGLLIFYALAIAIILSGGLAVFWFLRQKSKPLAVILSLLMMAVLVLLWPLPIHGGFMLLGEAIYSEWSRNSSRLERERISTHKIAFLARLETRFQGELNLVQNHSISPDWQKIVDASGHTGWLGTGSGMIWSEWLELAASASWPPLDLSKQRCARHFPVGFWALPTEAEHVLMWLAGGEDVLPRTNASTVSYTVDADFQMEMPTYRVSSGRNSGDSGVRQFSVRCVARGPGSPERGYIRKDIPLDDWNRYQLSK